MRATLQIATERGPGRRIEVRQGQIARFGSTDQADFRLPDDSLAEIHFIVECRPDGCRIRPATADTPTFLNGAAVVEEWLKTGDQIRAGRSALVVTLDGQPIVVADGGGPRPVEQKLDSPPASRSDWLKLFEYLELDEDALGVPLDGMTRETLLDALIAAGQFEAAARVRAQFLSPREAIWWGGCCLRELGVDFMSGAQQAATAAADAWLLNGSEENRRAAEAAARDGGYAGPGALLAAAAFWTGDNLGPPESVQPIPPDPRLVGKGVCASLLMATVSPDARHAVERWQLFLKLGRDVAQQKLTLPS